MNTNNYVQDLESCWYVIANQTQLLTNQQLIIDGLINQINQLKIALLQMNDRIIFKDNFHINTTISKKIKREKRIQIRKRLNKIVDIV